MNKEQMIKKLTYGCPSSVNIARQLAMTLEKVTKTEDLSENTLTSLVALCDDVERTHDSLNATLKKRNEYHRRLEEQRDEMNRLTETLDTINTLRKMIHYDE